MRKLYAELTGIVLGLILTIYIPQITHAQDAFTNINVELTVPDSIVQLTAEAQGLELLSPDVLPACGTFWVVTSNGLSAPYPCMPGDAILPVYSLADGTFCLFVERVVKYRLSVGLEGFEELVAGPLEEYAPGTSSVSVKSRVSTN